MVIKSKVKSRVSNNSQLTQFKFQWWMALILVGLVAILGIVIIRFSHAGTQWDQGNSSYLNDNLCVNGHSTLTGNTCMKSSTYKGM